MSSTATTPQIDQSVPMLSPDSKEARMITPDALESAKAAGWQPAVKMVGQQGDSRYIPQDQVSGARQNNYAVTPDNVGVMKAVDYNKGNVNYILPQEADSFHAAGNAIVQPDGSIRYPIIRDKNGVIAQDPVAEQQAHQKVYQALTADEAARNRSSELKDAAKAGAEATVDTATGVAGAGAMGSLAELGQVGLAKLGEAEAVQLFKSSPKLYTEYLLKNVAAPAAKQAALEALKHPLRTTSLVGGLGAAWHFLSGEGK